MSLTPDEMREHALNLGDLVAMKRREIMGDKAMGPASRAHLLYQIGALQDRVDEIIRTLGATAPSGSAAAGVSLPGVAPSIDPLPEVIRQPETGGNLASATGDLSA